MKKIYKYNKSIIISLICLFIISLLSIYGAQNMVNKGNLLLRQITWFIIGIIVVYWIIKIGACCSSSMWSIIL